MSANCDCYLARRTLPSLLIILVLCTSSLTYKYLTPHLAKAVAVAVHSKELGLPLDGAKAFLSMMEQLVMSETKALEEKLLKRSKPLKILFVHRHDRSNVGDWVACPRLYFDFFNKVQSRTLDIPNGKSCQHQQSVLNISSHHNAVIVGGGGLVGCNRLWDGTLERLARHPASVLWSPGINTVFSNDGKRNINTVFSSDGKRNIEDLVPDYVNDFKLHGLRDEKCSYV